MLTSAGSEKWWKSLAYLLMAENYISSIHSDRFITYKLVFSLTWVWTFLPSRNCHFYSIVFSNAPKRAKEGKLQSNSLRRFCFVLLTTFYMKNQRSWRPGSSENSGWYSWFCRGPSASSWQSDNERDLYIELVRLRRDLSEKEGVPAYMIFLNAVSRYLLEVNSVFCLLITV